MSDPKFDLKEKTVSGFLYKLLERVGAMGINFIISIVLARILMPEEYGLIALVTVFITICDVFVTYGFGNSLIVNKQSDDLDFSTCFFFGIALSIVVYALVFFGAPFLASFYNKELLIPILRVMGLRIPIAAVNSVQHAYVSKHMMFKKFFYSTLIGTVISGIIAVIMAYRGFGVWALVEQYLGNVIMDTFFLWIIVGWRPKAMFSFERLKRIYDYGWKILVVGLVDTGYTQLRSLLIAKRYSSEDLAYYNKGMQFPDVGMNVMESTINGVLFPSLSKCETPEMTKRATKKMISTSTYIIFPIMIGLAVTSEALIKIILTEKWMPCVIFMQIGCIAYMLRPILLINSCVVRASGRSGYLLKLDIIQKGFGVLVLFVASYYGVFAIALSLILTNLFATILNINASRKLIGYKFMEQFRDCLLNIILSSVMGIAAYMIGKVQIASYLVLILLVVVGVAVYLLISVFLNVEGFKNIIDLIKSYAVKKRANR